MLILCRSMQHLQLQDLMVLTISGIKTADKDWRLCRGVISQFHAVHSIMMVPFLPMRLAMTGARGQRITHLHKLKTSSFSIQLRIRKWKQRLGLPQVGENEIRAMQTGDFSNALKCTGCWPSVLFIKKLECWWFKVTWHSVCVLADNPVCFLSKNLECRWLKIQVTAPRKCPSIVCHFDFTEGYHCSWRMCYWKPHYSPQLIVNKRVFEGWIQGTRLTPSLQIYNDHRTRLWQLGKERIAVKL
jgi:hypothetical protein